MPRTKCDDCGRDLVASVGAIREGVLCPPCRIREEQESEEHAADLSERLHRLGRDGDQDDRSAIMERLGRKPEG